MNAPKYNISDLEKLSGIKAHTIRIWEKRYGIIHPERTETNIRYYTDEDLQRLLNITILNRNGFKISHISQMSSLEMEQEISKLSDNNGADDALINNLIQAAIELEENQIEKVLNSCILKLGFEEAFVQIVFPFLEKISILWQIGKLNACQERFVTNLIQHKLVVAINGLVGQSKVSAKNYLLYLPSGEFNELPLLFANYLLRKRGHHVVYLGPDIPFDHLRHLRDKEHYDGLVLSFSYAPKEKDLNDYIIQMRILFSGKQIIFLFQKQMPVCSECDQNVMITNNFSWLSNA